jgi:MerR family transcriptional regulator, thiopeptide resistance regulator
MNEMRTLKVGAVAEAAGLTVRTLHHWDHIGLLSPSERSPAGHREYTETDLVRLYQVLALRSLGLSLESIAVCLDAGVDPARLVRDQLAEVEAASAELDRRRATLHRLVETLEAGRVPDTAALLEAVRASTPSAEAARVLARHLDPDQLDTLRARGAAMGPLAHYLLEVEWPELYRRAERLRAAGTPPDDPRVRRLVARIDELGARFSGGDRKLSAGVRAAWADDPAGLANVPDEQATTWRELARYLELARQDTHTAVVPALLVATAVYGLFIWLRLGRVGR